MVVASINLILHVWKVKRICKCFTDILTIIVDMSKVQGIGNLLIQVLGRKLVWWLPRPIQIGSSSWNPPTRTSALE